MRQQSRGSAIKNNFSTELSLVEQNQVRVTGGMLADAAAFQRTLGVSRGFYSSMCAGGHKILFDALPAVRRFVLIFPKFLISFRSPIGFRFLRRIFLLPSQQLRIIFSNQANINNNYYYIRSVKENCK